MSKHGDGFGVGEAIEYARRELPPEFELQLTVERGRVQLEVNDPEDGLFVSEHSALETQIADCVEWARRQATRLAA